MVRQTCHRGSMFRTGAGTQEVVGTTYSGITVTGLASVVSTNYPCKGSRGLFNGLDPATYQYSKPEERKERKPVPGWVMLV